MSQRISLPVAVIVIAVSAPIALAFETLFRTQVMSRILGPDLNAARSLFSIELTSIAWALVGATVAAGILGLAILPVSIRRAEAKALARGEPTGDEPAARRATERLYLLTSIPQVPAILSTFCFTSGSQLTPVVVAMAVSTTFVLAQGLLAARILQRTARAARALQHAASAGSGGSGGSVGSVGSAESAGSAERPQ